MDNLDYYIHTDKARKLAYEIGDLIGELPQRRKDKTTDKAIVNIVACIIKLSDQLKNLEDK